ncbi:hypothetical protein ANCCEY_04037 [Ancylostoma ceylanicum]|uniref:Peptidase S9A N-terminal domain-containing protein n=1 Tax=Ancylostoma ceylanicum TaxID=53326 RepID=A0A0D6M3J5_9BILA|nr:hypothetical protein ANCCEY_04037 [Ancylostoma ceylanicum]
MLCENVPQNTTIRWQGYVDHDDESMLIITNRDAPMFKLIRVSLKTGSVWDVVPENKQAVLDSARPVSKDRLLTTYIEDVKHLRDSAKKAEGLRATKRRLSHETLELIRQHGAARAAGNYQLTSELARRCREAIKEDLKERRAAVLAEAAVAGRSIRNTRRDFAKWDQDDSPPAPRRNDHLI